MCIRINDTCQGINTFFEQSEIFYPACSNCWIDDPIDNRKCLLNGGM